MLSIAYLKSLVEILPNFVGCKEKISFQRNEVPKICLTLSPFQGSTLGVKKLEGVEQDRGELAFKCHEFPHQYKSPAS